MLYHNINIKNGYIIKGESVVKNSDGSIKEIHVTYDTDSLSGSGNEASKRKVAGTLHWVAINHAIEAEVRLYDRLFTDEAPDSHKEKSFLEFVNPSSLQIVSGFVEPSLQEAVSGTHYQFQRLGYFSVDKDSTTSKLVFNKTVGLKDAWEEKDKKEANLLMNTQKEINKYVKEKDADLASALLSSIVSNIESIDNYSLLTQTVSKNIKNDNNALLFSNLILKYSGKISFKDIATDSLQKLYTMSLKSQSSLVRDIVTENLQIDPIHLDQFQALI